MLELEETFWIIQSTFYVESMIQVWGVLIYPHSYDMAMFLHIVKSEWVVVSGFLWWLTNFWAALFTHFPVVVLLQNRQTYLII